MTVLMFITYHHNFCSHHGHHLCRGKIGDMMAFPLSQLRAQSSPTSPSSVCTPGCTTMVEMSHTRNELVFVVRSMDRWFGRSDWRIGRWVKAFMTCNQLQRIWHFVSMTRLFKKKKKAIKPAEFESQTGVQSQLQPSSNACGQEILLPKSTFYIILNTCSMKCRSMLTHVHHCQIDILEENLLKLKQLLIWSPRVSVLVHTVEGGN